MTAYKKSEVNEIPDKELKIRIISKEIKRGNKFLIKNTSKQLSKTVKATSDLKRNPNKETL